MCCKIAVPTSTHLAAISNSLVAVMKRDKEVEETIAVGQQRHFAFHSSVLRPTSFHRWVRAILRLKRARSAFSDVGGTSLSLKNCYRGSTRGHGLIKRATDVN